MKSLFIVALTVVLSTAGFSQEKIESDIDYAYQNAKKGIYWALSNIPQKKSKAESDLIANDRLYANAGYWCGSKCTFVEVEEKSNDYNVRLVKWLDNDKIKRGEIFSV